MFIKLLYEQEMNRVHEYVQALQAEWVESQRWADLSCFDRVDADKLRPAAEVANKLYDKMATQLQEETARLQALGKVKEDADHLNTLIQSQVKVIPLCSVMCVITVRDSAMIIL